MNLDAGNIINIVTFLGTLTTAGILLYKFRAGELPKMKQDGAEVITQASLSLVQEVKRDNVVLNAKIERIEGQREEERKRYESERADLLEQIHNLKEQFQSYIEDDIRIVLTIGGTPRHAKDVQISYVKADQS